MPRMSRCGRRQDMPKRMLLCGLFQMDTVLNWGKAVPMYREVKNRDFVLPGRS